MPLTHPISSIRSGGSIIGTGSTRAAVAFTVSANCTVNQIVRILFQGSGYSTSSSTRIGIATALTASPTWLGYHDGALAIDGAGSANSINLNADCSLVTGTTYYLVVQDDGGTSAVLTTANLTLTGMSWGVLFTGASYGTNNGSGFGYDVDFGDLTSTPSTVSGVVATATLAAPAGTATGGTGGSGTGATGAAAFISIAAPAGVVVGYRNLTTWTADESQKLLVPVTLDGTLDADVAPADPPPHYTSDNVNARRLSLFMPTPTLDSRGRPT